MIDVLIIVSYSFVAFCATVLAYHAVSGGAIPARVVGLSLAFMLLRGIAAGVNLHVGVMAPKYAGDFAIFWFQGVVEGVPTPADAASFAVLGILSTPGFVLLGPVKAVVLGVNNAALSLAPYLFFVGVRSFVPPRTAWLAFLLLMLYPGANNFGFFGLRDPVIYLGVTLLVTGLLRVTARQKTARESVFLVCLGSVMALWSRPELATILVPGAFLVYFDLINRFRAQSRRIQYLRVLLGLVGLPVMVVALFMAFRIATADIGFADAGLDDVVTEYGRIRYERQFEDKDASGDQSPIIPPEQYSRLPVWARVAVQSAGMIVLPFPTQIRSATQALAFGDSLFVLWILGMVLLRARLASGRGPFLWTTLVAVGVMGTVVNNFGNAFRMRLVLVPILIMALVDAAWRSELPEEERVSADEEEAGEALTEDLSAEDLTIGPSVEESPAEESPAGESPAEESSAEDSGTENPSPEDPSPGATTS